MAGEGCVFLTTDYTDRMDYTDEWIGRSGGVGSGGVVLKD